jgi:hypothetical protein
MPVISVDDLASLPVLSDAERIEAYQDGATGLPCGGNRCRAYWHAWRQGAMDGKRREPDAYDHLLAREVVSAGGPSGPRFEAYLAQRRASRRELDAILEKNGVRLP